MSELRSTVEADPNILEVHFDTNGVHYFHARKKDGVMYGQFFNGLPIISSRITETKTREEVLGISRNFDSEDKQDFIDEQKGDRKRKR